GAGRRADGGLVHRRRSRWLQHHAARAAGDAGGLYCRRDPIAPTARAVSYSVRGRHAAGALWVGGTAKPVRVVPVVWRGRVLHAGGEGAALLWLWPMDHAGCLAGMSMSWVGMDGQQIGHAADED